MKQIVLTNKLIEAGCSRNGGWSSRQLALFGIDGFPKGWKRKLVGQRFPSNIVDQFIRLKDKHLPKV